MLGIGAAVSVLAACSGSAAPGSAYAGHATAAATLRSGIGLSLIAATRAPAKDSVLAETAPGLKLTGIPVDDVPFVSVGGGIGSFVAVDYLRICGQAKAALDRELQRPE